MKRPPDLWALRIFTEVAITRSMTRAAERLDLTQSAVSQAIRKLEGTMGVPLLDRAAHPAALTSAGVTLHRRAEALLADAARLVHQVRGAGDMPAEEVRLGFVDTFASTAGPALVRALAAAGSRVVLWSGLSGSLEEALFRREVDAIVSADPLEDHDGLQRFALCREPYILLVPRDMPGASAGSLQALGDALPIIRFSARSHAGRQVDRHLRRVGFTGRRRLEVDGADAMVAMVAAGVGWAVATPLALLQGAAHAPHVRALLLPGPGFSRTLTLVCPAGTDAALARLITAEAKRALVDAALPRLAALAPDMAACVIVEPFSHDLSSHKEIHA